jgi:hypothetical protein
MLGHASIEQTSAYLNVRAGGLLESMRRLDASRTESTLSMSPTATAASRELLENVSSVN